MRKAGREGILSAALRLMGTEGPASVAMRDIAAAAGVTEPAIYRHFQSKRHLLTELFRHCADRLYGYLDERARDADGPLGTLSALASGLFEFAFDHPDEYAVIVAVHNRELRELDIEAERLPKDLFVAALQQLHERRGGSRVSPTLAAGAIIGAVLGVVLFAKLTMQEGGAESCAEYAARIAVCLAEASCVAPASSADAADG